MNNKPRLYPYVKKISFTLPETEKKTFNPWLPQYNVTVSPLNKQSPHFLSSVYQVTDYPLIFF